jgi:hypothetical protein
MIPQLIGEVLSAVGALWGAGSFAFAHASVSWPTTKGRIVASVVDENFDSRGHRREEPMIAYEYTVAGRGYVRAQINGGLDVSWSTTLRGISGAQEIVDQFPLDSEVDVHYWPRFPGVACLRPGRYAGGVWAIVASVSAFLVIHFLA